MNRDGLIDSIIQNATATARAQADGYKLGMDYAEVRHRTIMRAIAKQYAAAVIDPNAAIPSGLGVMLEAVLQTVKGYEQEAVAHPDTAARHAGL